ncbi:MAG: sigma-70 family RNA polymerase sigma factor [Planctomycetota bacterium]
MTDTTDAELIKAFRDTGADEAFERLLARYHRQMYGLAISILRHEADAMDGIQDATIRVYQNLDALADPRCFKAWLMRIVFGCCIDRLRSRKKARPEELNLASEELACERPTPAQRLAAREWLALVRQEIESLPPRYRRPLVLFHLDGLSIKQVARHLDIPIGTASSLLTRARRQLRSEFPEDLQEVPDMIHQVFNNQSPSSELLADTGQERLHIMNGDAAADRLRASGLADRIAVWTDILHEGPTPLDTSPAQWRRARAEHLSSMGFADAKDITDRMARVDAEIAAPGDGVERVLWFEHDLYDQLLLIRHLHWLSLHDKRHRPSFSLICIGEFPGIHRFVGLGQLEPDQIISLLDTRMPIEEVHVELGAAAWCAYCHTDPTKLAALLSTDTSALPYLQDAIRRHLQQLPSCVNGLGLTEQLILESVADGPKTAGAVFAGHNGRESAPFIGDGVAYHYIQRLASESDPAIKVDDAHCAVMSHTRVSITSTGNRLLAGELDRVQHNGLDRWFGGTRATGKCPVWRWNAEDESVVYR